MGYLRYLRRELAEFFADEDNFEIICIASIVLSLIAFIYFLRRPLVYGRIINHADKRKKLGVSSKLALFVSNAVSLPFFLGICYLWSDIEPVSYPFILYVCMTVYRAVIYPLIRSKHSAPWPLTTMAYFSASNILKAIIAARLVVQTSVDFEDVADIVKTCVFVVFALMQMYCDITLTKMRSVGERGYKVPKGVFFSLVSSPSYLFEAIMWSIWVSLVEFNIGSVAFLMWLLPNVYARAEAVHAWYKKTYKAAYPKKRTAFIPFLNISQILRSFGSFLEYGGF